MELHIKVPAVNSDNLSVILGTHLIEGELVSVSCPVISHVHHSRHMKADIYTQ